MWQLKDDCVGMSLEERKLAICKFGHNGFVFV